MQPPTVISAQSIAAGLGLAERQDLCAALAVLEATHATALTKGAFRRLIRRKDSTRDDMANAAKALDASPVSTATLRFRLWSELTQALGLPDQYALSERSLRRDAAAMGVRAVEILAPGHQAAKGKGWLRRLFRRRSKTSFTFADLLAAEAQAMIESAEQAGTTDPKIAESLSKAKTSIAAAAVAGGGWVVGATAVASAGFAPYMVAASASAFIPLPSGPALVSMLAVLVNPVKVLAGATALGFWTVRGSTAKARQTAAARLAILLALRRSADERDGLPAMIDALRGGQECGDERSNAHGPLLPLNW